MVLDSVSVYSDKNYEHFFTYESETTCCVEKTNNTGHSHRTTEVYVGF